MRGLNLLKLDLRSRSKEWWRNQQQVQIDQATSLAGDTQTAARALFPGSMLFNQILLSNEVHSKSFDAKLFAPESLSVAYEYCSHIHVKGELERSLVIDTGSLASIESADAIVEMVENDSEFEQVIFLGQAAQSSLAHLVVKRLDPKLKVTMLEPDWKSAYALHVIYRQARHVIFIDTMRVLDAAYTQCRCSLLASAQFARDPAFELLALHLQRIGCTVRSQGTEPLRPSLGAVKLPFLVAQNQQSDLNEKLALSISSKELVSHEDWLQGYISASEASDNSPVISHVSSLSSHAARGVGAGGFRDYKTRVARKTVKLREDPRAFLTDSNIHLLNVVARFIPKKAI